MNQSLRGRSRVRGILISLALAWVGVADCPLPVLAQAAGGDLQARIQVGEFHIKQGEWQKARDLFLELSADPNAPASVFRGLGEAYFNLRERDKARDAFEIAVRRGPDAEAERRLIDIVSEDKQGWPRATTLLQGYVGRHPDDVGRRRRLAELLVYQGRIQEAVPELARVVEARPNDTDMRMMYARALVWTGRAREARDQFARATKEGAGLQRDDNKWIGHAEEASGNMQAAFERYRTHVAGAPEDADGLAGLARTAMALRRTDDADRAIAQVRELSVKRPELAVVVARLEVQRGQRAEALPEYKRALDSDPRDTALAKEYSDILGSVGEKHAAEQVRSSYGLPAGEEGRGGEPAAQWRPTAATVREIAAELQRNPSADTWQQARGAMLGAPLASLTPAFVDEVSRHFADDADVRQREALFWANRGQTKRAADVYRQMLAASPGDPKAIVGLASLQLRTRDLRGASATLDQAGPAISTNPDMLSLRAGVEFSRGDLAAAERDYKAALALRPRMREATQGLQRLQQARAGGRRGARTTVAAAASDSELQRALKQEPERVDYRLRMAQSLEKRRKSEEALAMYIGLQDERPRLREAYLGPVRIHMAQGDVEAARDAYDDFQRLFPGEQDPVAAGMMALDAERLKRAGDYAGALRSYQEALRLNPNDAGLWRGVAGVYFKARQLDDALQAFQMAAQTDPRNEDGIVGQVDVLSALAAEAMARGDDARAVVYVDQALKASDGNVRALERTVEMAISTESWDVAEQAARRLPNDARGRKLRELIDVERQLTPWRRNAHGMAPARVLELAERGLKVAPGRPDLLLIRAQALEQSGKSEQAVAAYRELRELPSPPEDAYAGEARALAASGRFDEAHQGLAEVRQRDPEQAASLEHGFAIAEADTLRRRGDTAAALAVAKQAVAMHPDDADALMTLGGLYSDAQDYPHAILSYGDALRLRPEDPVVQKALAGAYHSNGDLEQAGQLYDAVLTASPGDEEARRERAEVWAAGAGRYLAVGDTGSAERSANEALRLDPDNGDARAVRAQLSARRYEVAAPREYAVGTPLPHVDVIAGRTREVPEVAQYEAAPYEAPARVVAEPSVPSRYEPVARYTGEVVEPDRSYEPPARLIVEQPVPPQRSLTSEKAAALRAQAVALKNRGRTAEAIDLTRQSLTLDPENPDTLQLLGGLYSDARDYREAIAAYQEALRIRPEDRVSQQGLAGAFHGAGDLVEAARLYDERLQNDPSDTSARRGRVSIYNIMAGQAIEAGDPRAASDYLDRALELDPGNADASAMKVQMAMQERNWAQARAYAQALPDSAQARRQQEVVDVQQRLEAWRADPSSLTPEAALALANRGLRAEPDRVDFRLDQARATEWTGNNAAALKIYQELADAPSPPAEAYAGQMRTLVALNRFSDAERVLDDFTRVRPEAANAERANLYRARASAYRGMHQYQEAFSTAQQALALNPSDPDTLGLLGGIYVDQRQYEDAVASFQAALAVRPDDGVAVQGLAGSYEALGDFAAAEQAYHRLEGVPGYSVPQSTWRRVALRRDLEQAAALQKANRLGEARELLERLREREPREPEVWGALAEVTRLMGMKSLALAYTEQGLSLDPGSRRLQAERVRCLAENGQYDQAERALRTAGAALGPDEVSQISLDLRRARARQQREKFVRAGQYDQAYLQLAREYQASPNDPEVLKSIGYLYLGTKQYDTARQFFARAQEINPDDPDVRLGAAYAMRGAGDPRGAVKALNAEYKKRPSADLALALAEIYHDMGRDEDAGIMLSEARRLGGGSRPPVFGTAHLEPGSGEYYSSAWSDSVLPPLRLPSGTVRAVPGTGPDRETYQPEAPPSRYRWQGSKLETGAPVGALAFVAGDTLNDAAPPEAAWFAGPALAALAGGAAGAGSDQLAQRLPSFESVLRDVGSRPVPARQAPVEMPVAAPEPMREVPVEEPEPRRYRPAPAEVEPEPARLPSFSGRPIEEETVGELETSTAPLPPIHLDWERTHDATSVGAPRPGDRGIGVYSATAEVSSKPLSVEARARAERLASSLERRQATKLGVGFRYDFLDGVYDVNADEFAIWRIPLYVDWASFLNSRARLKIEPTIVDNGNLSDTGLAAEAAVRDLTLGTNAVRTSLGIGMTPAGFKKDPDITAFARLQFYLADSVSLTPFYERKPVTESLLSFRGNKSRANGRADGKFVSSGSFFGKIIQDRVGGNLSFRTSTDVTGSLEGAYSLLDGTNVSDNNKVDAYMTIGRDFPVFDYYTFRPAVNLVFFHYDHYLEKGLKTNQIACDPRGGGLCEPQPPSGGYFDPDSFIQTTVGFAFSGPLAPDDIPGSRFSLRPELGGQWIDGVSGGAFEDSEGSRFVFGGEGSVDLPIGDIAVLSSAVGGFLADPYSHIYFIVDFVFPL